MTYRIAICAGELSGDEHLSGVIRAIRSKFPDAEIRGMAGPATRSIPVNTELRLEKYASVMGFGQIVRAAPEIISALKWFSNLMTSWKPDLLLLTDYPDFNLRLAKIAKKKGIKVLYYIPPKIWIWRTGRIKLIEKFVDKVALIFPFEKAFYEKLGYKRSVYVGHPFYSSISREMDPNHEKLCRNEFLTNLNLDPGKPVLAFFPGSRAAEIRRHWPGMVAGLRELLKKIPDLQIVLSVADPVRGIVNDFLRQNHIKCTCLEGRNLEILRYSDAGFLKSGTTNLQAAFYELPFLMYYQASRLSEIIVRALISIREFSLVNLIRPGTVTELLQNDGNPQRICQELHELLTNNNKRAEMIAGLREVRSILSSSEDLPIFSRCSTPAERVAELAVEMLKESAIKATV